MIRLILVFAMASLLHAQSAMVTRGEEVYKVTCGVAYCHGSGGTTGRAPQLAGRGFAAQYVFSTVLYGKPGTAMPAFGQQLKSEEIEAVTQYIVSLPAPAGSATVAPKAAAVVMPEAVQKGRALFFDATRMSGCGKCHELQDRGTAVGPDLKSMTAAQLRDLRVGSKTRVVTVSAAGEEPFPGVVVEQTAQRVRVYDISAGVPVLRAFAAAQVRISPGNGWSHAFAVLNYSDAEIEAIRGYLEWIAAQPAKN
jgi:mono/diheme cytochrome c family protein